MKLLTSVEIPEYPFRIDHLSPVLMLGSCFTVEVGRRLEEYLFPVCVNPFGTIYNPLSVKRVLEVSLEKRSYEKEDLDRNGDLWFSFDHSTAFSSIDFAVALDRMNKGLEEARDYLKEARDYLKEDRGSLKEDRGARKEDKGTMNEDRGTMKEDRGSLKEPELLILTWGTSWVFRLRENGRVVANCHKLPSDHFLRSRLSVEEIVNEYESLLSGLFRPRPELKVLFTVSPVRHWKDGAHGNQLSKATLLLAVEKLLEKFPERCFYFPSYEIMMDELRDYRWYAGDMLHPAGQASGYIWERFAEAVLTDETKSLNKELRQFLDLKNHRPVTREGAEYEKLQAKLVRKEREMRERYPHLSWSRLA